MAIFRVIFVANSTISQKRSIFIMQNHIFSESLYIVHILIQVRRYALEIADKKIFFRKVGKFPDQDLEPCHKSILSFSARCTPNDQNINISLLASGSTVELLQLVLKIILETLKCS